MTWIVISAVISLLLIKLYSQRSWQLLGVIVTCHACLVVLWFALDGVSDNGFDESVIYHMATGLHGAGLAGYETYVLSWSAVLLLTLTVIVIFFKKNLFSIQTSFSRFLLIFIPLSLFDLNPFIVDVRNQSLLLQGLARNILGFDKGSVSLGQLKTLYVEPSNSRIESANKNVVLIYLEGMESNFLDISTFGDLAPELRALSREALTFNDINMPKYTHWTIGGMVGSQCGLPLIPLGAAGGNELRGYKNFLPGAVCTGDLLAGQGYKTEYIGGASLSFAGKGDFLTSHGYQSSWGIEELYKVMPRKTPRNVWGYHDDVLFQFGQKRFVELYESQSPFLLTMLTIGTHPPKGYLAPDCKEKGVLVYDDPMRDAVRCTDNIVAQFIRFILDHDVDKNTVIVLFSDHLAHPNSESENLEKSGPRKLLLWVWGQHETESEKIISKRGTTFDVAPTVLYLAGADVDGLGFGRNLFTKESSRLVTDDLLNQNALTISKHFWLPPSLTEDFYLDIEQSELTWGERHYSLPLVIQFDGDFNGMSFYWSTTLNSLLSKFGEPSSIMIDRCHWASSDLSGQWCFYYRNVLNQVSFELLADNKKLGSELLAVLSGNKNHTRWDPENENYLVSTSGPKLFSGLVAGGKDIPFESGLNIVQVTANGPQIIASLDPCRHEVQDEDMYRISQLVKTSKSDTYLAVKGTLGCNRYSHEKLIAEFDTDKLKILDYGEPYIAQISSAGRVVSEISAKKGQRVYYKIPKLPG